MNENIAALKEAIRLKDSPMKVAHMRLNTRSYRPNIELVRDPVQYGLVEEVAQITDSIEALAVSFEFNGLLSLSFFFVFTVLSAVLFYSKFESVPTLLLVRM